MIIDGKALAASLRAGLKQEVAAIKEKHGVIVGLGAVLDPNSAPSRVYVGSKQKACQEIGIYSEVIHATNDNDQVAKAVESFNQNKNIHGILLQLPLPTGIDETLMLDSVDPRKDADGLHPYNLGKLFAGQSTVEPCTPAGIMRLLKSANCDLNGKRAVVLGRSRLVGNPIAQLLMQANATVVHCHSHSQNVAEEVAQADVVVAAVGKPQFVAGDWIKPGAYVIDVGINRLDDGRLVGDVDFDSAIKRANYITPVPGGVGPMTVAMLLHNTVELAKRQLGEDL